MAETRGHITATSRARPRPPHSPPTSAQGRARTRPGHQTTVTTPTGGIPGGNDEAHAVRADPSERRAADDPHRTKVQKYKSTRVQEYKSAGYQAFCTRRGVGIGFGRRGNEKGNGGSIIGRPPSVERAGADRGLNAGPQPLAHLTRTRRPSWHLSRGCTHSLALAPKRERAALASQQ
jgi:hypothetical protein